MNTNPERFKEVRDNLGASMNLAKTTDDMVNHPSHYTGRKVECLTCIEVVTEHMSGMDAFLAGQVIKYLYRCTDKGNKSLDLSKAKFYMDKLQKRNKVL